MAIILEELGDEYRKENIIKNTYQNAQGNQYGQKHKNALSDGDNKGKGTGLFLDTYNGGGIDDIVGSSNEPGSGLLSKLIKNKYSEEKPYTHPTIENEMPI